MAEELIRETEGSQAVEPGTLLSVPYSPEVLQQNKKTLKDYAEPYTEKAIQALVKILDSTLSADMAKISAATALLDRAHGKPKQYVEQTTQIVTYQDLLNTIAEKEKAYIEVVEAQQIKQVSPDTVPLLTWDDVI